MDKFTKGCTAILLCCLMIAVCVCSVSAQPTSDGLFGLPRAAESVVGDVTGAINDAIGEVTGGMGTDTATGDAAGCTTDGMMGDMTGGTNVPQDSAGVVTEPESDPVTTANSTTNDSQSGTETTADESGSGGSFVGIIIAIIAAIAVVLLIIALMPKKKND